MRLLFGHKDYVAYLAMLRDSAKDNGCAIHSLVLMTNHTHILVTPDEESSIGCMMQCLGRKYVQFINRSYERTGTLWEGRYKSSIVDSDHYFFNVCRYIELNPVRANMVSIPADYRWSSYHCNGTGIPSTLLTPHPLYLALGNNNQQRQAAYRGLFGETFSEEDLTLIRKSSNRCKPIGDEVFVDAVKEYQESTSDSGMMVANDEQDQDTVNISFTDILDAKRRSQP